MNAFLFKAKEYLKYLLKAEGAANIHSPFVFDFVKQVLHDNRNFYCYHNIEELRNALSESKEIIEVKDWGAGSQVSSADRRRIRSIVKHAATKPAFAQLLFRMGVHYESKKILELGTSLGITTLYLSSISKEAKVISIEGDATLAAAAKNVFDSMEQKNITLLQGSFEEHIHPALKILQQVDFVYVDGNHRKEATLNYFKTILEFTHEKSILVFGDIYWSEEMKLAWKEIKAHPQVTISIDLFFMGIIFFRKELSKQDFIIRY
ncbi:MAG: class I SAM-dependent methyltransferase [Chitinophagales bacterium]|nr:class I SAM-dependent methyltransferase [Chitinophagales bacterium]